MQPPVVIAWYSARFVKYDRECLFLINIMAESSPDGLSAGRGRTLGSCLCPFAIVCLDMRSERKHVERPQYAGKECFASSFAPAQAQSPNHGLTCCPLNTDCPQLNLPRHYRSSYPFLYSSVTLLSSTDQVRKIRSSLSTLLFVHGYKPQVAAGCICQHVNVTSAGVRHSNVACLTSYVYHNYH